MANVTAADFNTKPRLTLANAYAEDFGAVAATGVLQNEKVYLGVIPAGTRLQDVRAITSGSLGATTTLSLGFEPMVAGDGPTANATYWLNAVASTAALNSQSSSLPITFERDVKLVATVGGAAVTGSPTIAAVVQGKYVGVK